MTDNSTPPRLVSGKYVILALLALGAAAAVGSWSYYALVQRWPMRFWGAETARLIAQAPQVEALRLEYAHVSDVKPASEPFVVVDRQRLVDVEKHDITGRPGLGHVRSALLNTASFGQTYDMVDDQPVWHYALRFSNDSQTATVVFSGDGQWTASSEGTTSVSLTPVADELASFLREQFSTEVEPRASPGR